MPKYDFEYTNEYEFRKLERSIKKYNMLAFKKLYFDYYPNLREGKFLGNIIKEETNKIYYELKLPTDKVFERVHGTITLYYIFDKDKNIIILDKFEPNELLTEGHHYEYELLRYKGVLISKEHRDKDMFKINLLNNLNKYDK